MGILRCLRLAFAPYEKSYTLAGFADTILAPETIHRRLSEMNVLVAVGADREIIGTIGCLASGREGHLRGMAVLPDWQGHGVAAQLLQASEEVLRERNCTRVTLDTTAPLRRAVRFYEKHGYRASGKVTDFFGMPLFEYVKELKERQTSMQETPKQYTKRMLGNVAGKNPLAVQAAIPGKLARLIRGLSPAQLRRRPAPGKWSIGEILAHLADAELVAGYRFRMMLNSSGGGIQAFDQNDWARNGRYDRIDARRSLEALAAMRAYNVRFLKSLKPAVLKRYGMHAERGKESIAHYMRMMAGHDLNHLAQVQRIAASYRGRK